MRALLCLALLPGCALIDGLSGGGGDHDAAIDSSGNPASGRHVGIFDLKPRRDLDLVLVVDNSSGMVPFQTALGNAMPNLVAALGHATGGRPSLHIGITTSTLGAGPYNIQQCIPPGDDGLFSNNGCTVTGTYVTDLDNGDGSRTTNVTGALDGALACMVQRGQTGCGFEQHVGAAQRAVTNTNNVGFLRDSADLMVMVFGNEDDCTVTDASLFDPANTSLGPLASYRCTAYGVDCDTGNSDPEAAGPRTGCHSRVGSLYMPTAADMAASLLATKTDPTTVMFTALVGPPTPFAVDLNPQMNNDAELTHVCTSSLGFADPAVRTTELAGKFPARGLTESLCGTDFGDAMTHVGDLAADALGRVDAAGKAAYCLVGDDTDALTAGRCWVDQVTNLDQPGEHRTHIPSCAAAPGASPCYRIEADAATCAIDAAHARLYLDHLSSPPPDERIVVDCP